MMPPTPEAPTHGHILLLVSSPLDASIHLHHDVAALARAVRDLPHAATFHVHAAEVEQVQALLADHGRPLGRRSPAPPARLGRGTEGGGVGRRGE